MADKESIWSRQMSLREQGQVIRQLIQFARPYSRYFYGALAFSVFVSVIHKFLLPRVLQEFMNHHLQTASASLQILIVFASVYFVLTVVKAATQYFELYWFTSAAEFMLENVRVRLFKKLHGLGMRYFDQTPAGSLVSRVTNDTASFADFWQLFLMLTTSLLSIVSSFIAMWLTNVRVTMVTVVFVTLLF